MNSNYYGSNLPPQVRTSLTALQRSQRATIKTGAISQSAGAFNNPETHSIQEGSEYWLDNAYTANPVDDVFRGIDVGLGDNGTVHSSINLFYGKQGLDGPFHLFPVNGSYMSIPVIMDIHGRLIGENGATFTGLGHAVTTLSINYGLQLSNRTDNQGYTANYGGITFL